MKFQSIAEVKEANRANGSYWFEKETMDFFRTHIHTDLIDGRYFITSEKPPNGPIAFTIREVTTDKGNIHTVGEFCGYKTLHKAKQALKAITEPKPEPEPEPPMPKHKLQKHKPTNPKIIAVRELYAQGHKQARIAEMVGISKQRVSQILKGN